MPTKASAAPAPPGAPAPTPYEEHHHYRFRHPDVKNTVKARQRSFRAIQVERDNTHIQRRLNELRREPASRFHAPDGELSLRPKSQRTYGPRAAPRRRPEWDDGGGRSSSTSLRDGERRKTQNPSSGPAGGKTQTKERRARHWPPPRFPRGVYAENTEVMRQNASLQRRLVNQYRASRDSQLVREGKGRPVDGLALWAKRLAVYDPHPPNRARTTDANRQVRQHRRPEDPDRRAVQRHRAVDLLRRRRPQATGAPRLPRPVLLREVVRRIRRDGRDDATRGDRLRDRVPVEATEGALVAAREGAGRVVGGQQAHEALADPHAPDGASGSVFPSKRLERLGRRSLRGRLRGRGRRAGPDPPPVPPRLGRSRWTRSGAGWRRAGCGRGSTTRNGGGSGGTSKSWAGTKPSRSAAAPRREEIAAEGRAEAEADATDADATGVEK